MRIAAVVCGITLLLTSCRTVTWRADSTDVPASVELLDDDGVEVDVVLDDGLPLSVEQRFSDIPLPAQVREDLEHTYVFESPSLQIGRMVYTSRASVKELAQFFIRECPAADWELKNLMEADGVKLVFEKPGKRLVVEIRDQGVGRAKLLVLDLTPESEADSR